MQNSPPNGFVNDVTETQTHRRVENVQRLRSLAQKLPQEAVIEFALAADDVGIGESFRQQPVHQRGGERSVRAGSEGFHGARLSPGGEVVDTFRLALDDVLQPGADVEQRSRAKAFEFDSCPQFRIGQRIKRRELPPFQMRNRDASLAIPQGKQANPGDGGD